ncbi:MAG: MBL fold metallo-hydrolase, partial [Chlamydiota bacterium]
MQGRLTFLGTSASMGVPIIGCLCGVCLSKSPYNKRMRSAALLEVGGKNILIDVGPDFRTQALASSLTTLF